MTFRRLQTTEGQTLRLGACGPRPVYCHGFARLPVFNHPVANTSAAVTPFEVLTFPLAPDATLPVFRIVPPLAQRLETLPYADRSRARRDRERRHFIPAARPGVRWLSGRRRGAAAFMPEPYPELESKLRPLADRLPSPRPELIAERLSVTAARSGHSDLSELSN